MKLPSRIIAALAIGAAVSYITNFSAPPARLIIWLGVAAVAFFALPSLKED